MIIIEGTRFGTIEVDESTVLRFENGLVGFPEQTEFVLLERTGGKLVAFLQSVTTPSLAFPIMDAAELGDTYPEPSVDVLAKGAGLEGNTFGLLVIVAVNQQTRTLEANMLAPIIAEMETRRCAQVVLDARKYSAAHSLAPQKRDPVAEAKARIAAIRAQREARRASV